MFTTLLKCKNCNTTFNTTNHFPKCGPCGHTYCLSCINKKGNSHKEAKDKAWFMCNNDNTIITITNSYSNLLIIEAINQLSNGGVPASIEADYDTCLTNNTNDINENIRLNTYNHNEYLHTNYSYLPINRVETENNLEKERKLSNLCVSYKKPYVKTINIRKISQSPLKSYKKSDFSQKSTLKIKEKDDLYKNLHVINTPNCISHSTYLTSMRSKSSNRVSLNTKLFGNEACRSSNIHRNDVDYNKNSSSYIRKSINQVSQIKESNGDSQNQVNKSKTNNEYLIIGVGVEDGIQNKSFDSITNIDSIDEKSIVNQSFKEELKKIINPTTDLDFNTNTNTEKRNFLLNNIMKKENTSQINQIINKTKLDSSLFKSLLIKIIDKSLLSPVLLPILKQNKQKIISILIENTVFIGSQMTKNKKGTLFSFLENQFFEGEIDDSFNKLNGRLLFQNGIKYEGSFLNNKQNGFGVMTQPDGEVYSGQWSDGRINGKGVRSHSNGDRYEGYYVNSIRSGYGIYYFKNGDRYEGNWDNGQANGKGKFYYSNGNRYEGEFSHNQINGKGVFYCSNGDVFKGDFENGLVNGYGKHILSNGDQYIGEFVNGMRNGNGSLMSKTNEIISSGYWKDNKLIGNGCK